MPSLETYKKRIGATTTGQLHKINSDIVLESTWDNDITSCIGYLYDQFHDEEFNVSSELFPQDTSKIAVKIKFYEVEYHSLSKDEVPYHIMFQPSYEPNVPYYEEIFSQPYGSHFPIGLYIDIPDSKDRYHRWLIVDQYREYSPQHPSYLVLPCEHKLQWIYDGKKYESWCVQRSQSSYNQGTWTDYRTTSVENQKKIWLPTNPKTQTIYYDQRIVISEPRDIPITWHCTKVEETNVHGISRYTFAQDKWNPHTDYIEKDNSGKIIGMWADYNASAITPIDDDEPISEDLRVVITPVGKSTIMIGYSKKLKVAFYENDNEIDVLSGNWSFSIDDENIENDVTIINETDSQIEIKLNCDDVYIGEVLLVTYTSDNGITAQAELEIGG